MNVPIIACLLAAIPFFFLDLHRRRLSLIAFQRLPALDLLPIPLTAGCTVAIAAVSFRESAATGILAIHSFTLWGLVLGGIFTFVLWFEGKKQIQFQRPIGLLFGEWLFLMGAVAVVARPLIDPPGSPLPSELLVIGGLTLLSAVFLIMTILPPFMRKYEGLRILERVGDDEQFVQPEYMPATPECPHPQLWHMLDSQTTEVEVLNFLKTLVTAIKPKLIVETGTFLGHSTTKLAEGARENGFGKVITIEFDPAIRQRALRRFETMGLSSWIDSRLESSLDTVIDGTIDLLYSDSHLANREAEIRRLLPQLDPRGLLVIHDAGSHFRIVREAALRLEEEGLISVVLLATPRGVVIAQRRAGRE